jgi:hypothetical protein
VTAHLEGPVVGASPPALAPTWATQPGDGDPDVVVEEHHLVGTAVAYEPAPGTSLARDGRWRLVPAGTARYRTRLLVVRPREGRAANGTVLLEWLNVSAGHELGGPDRRDLAAGTTWVGVSAQQVGVLGAPPGWGGRFAPSGLPLVERDPQRYGTLHHPGDQGAAELFRDAARLVGPDRPAAPDPLGGIEVRRVVAVGASQSAMRLAAYVNGFGPGELALDGVLLRVWEGRAPRPDDGALDVGGVRTGLRTDLDVPVVVVNSEFEAAAMAERDGARLAPDGPMLRIWEVAGAPHAVWSGRDPGAGRVGVNRLRLHPVVAAGRAALLRWVEGGPPAPAQPRVEVDPATGRLARDRDGNALGGVRLPELAAPTHAYRGSWMGTGRPALFGGAVPLPDDVLLARYGDAAGYRAAWDAGVDALAAGGAVLPADAGAMRARWRAAVSPVLRAPDDR